MDVVFLLFLWVACGVLSAMLAANKNRNVAGWFFIGFLFGPFGFLAALVVEKLPPDGASATPAPPLAQRSGSAASRAVPTTRPCPYCAEDIKPEAVKCRYCGSDVEALAARCTFCAQLAWKPGIPCSAASEDMRRDFAPTVASVRCREELASRGYLEHEASTE